MNKADEALKRRVRQLQRERAKLRFYIRYMQWVQPAYNGNPSCAFCGIQEHLHTPCEVSRYIDTLK